MAAYFPPKTPLASVHPEDEPRRDALRGDGRCMKPVMDDRAMLTVSGREFDPGVWLGAFTAIGGGYALMSGRKLAFLVDECDAENLTGIMAQIVGQPERQEAIKGVIEQRSFGDVA